MYKIIKYSIIIYKFNNLIEVEVEVEVDGYSYGYKRLKYGVWMIVLTMIFIY